MEPQRIQELIATYRDGLLNDTLPFWLRHAVDREHAERRPGAVRAQLEARAVLLLLARPPVPVLTIEVLVVLAAQARVRVSDGCCDEMDGVRTWSRR